MKQLVDNATPPHPLAELFKARRGWLRRFCKRYNLALRRKSNNKKVPIEERKPLLKRYFAVFRLHLRSFRNRRGFSPRWSIYEHRWSVDQVPAGAFDPKQTYEVKGVKRVCIANNDAFDKHRWLTLQILVRNRKVPHLPRCGQPRLTLCFRGTGQRIAATEIAQYHKDVIVLFQPKAWFDGPTCNKWVLEAAAHEILKSELKPGQRHLILADNLNGQTKKCNPKFLKLLDDLCSADVWNLLAGNTDGIQVVDAGLGKLVKDESEDIACEWLRLPANWEEWTGGRMPASRKRILFTHWYAEGYERACQRFDFCASFNKTGSNLSADGTGDDQFKIQGLSEFSFDMADARRDAKTGQFPVGEEAAALGVDEGNAAAVAAAAACDSADEEGDPEAATDQSGTEEEEGGSTSDEDLEGADFDLAVDVHSELPDGYPACVIGKQVYHRYEEGWYRGSVTVLRKITLSTCTSRNLMTVLMRLTMH